MSGDGDEVLYAELAGDLRRRSHRAFEDFQGNGTPVISFCLLLSYECGDGGGCGAGYVYAFLVCSGNAAGGYTGEYLSLCFGEKFLPELLQASPCGRYQPDKTYRSLDLYGVPAIRRGRGPVRKGAGLLA